MKWKPDADKAIEKVPFFVRKRVRTRVEETARAAGRNQVTMTDVNVTRQRFLKKMDKEVKGYQADACFGANGCPNRIIAGDLMDKIEEILKSADLPGFLREQVGENLKFHHEFRITISDCPNACSQPQIKDIGIIAAQKPGIKDIPCTQCMACVNICKEKAVTLVETENNDDEYRPVIDFEKCVQCGQCIDDCPTGTIDTDTIGYRILIGGKLGRHPRLARELPGIYSEPEALDVIRRCIRFYKAHSKNGERFAQLVAKDDTFVAELVRKLNFDLNENLAEKHKK